MSALLLLKPKTVGKYDHIFDICTKLHTYIIGMFSNINIHWFKHIYSTMYKSIRRPSLNQFKLWIRFEENECQKYLDIRNWKYSDHSMTFSLKPILIDLTQDVDDVIPLEWKLSLRKSEQVHHIQFFTGNLWCNNIKHNCKSESH